MSVKEQVLQAIQRLPDDADSLAIADEVALIVKAKTSREQTQDGQDNPAAPGTRQPRPSGLCVGEFVTPADFDDPLPADVLRDFEGA